MFGAVKTRITTLVICIVFCCGCAHIPLRRNTISQARTVADIHQQQVLNNLAMFVYNPNSMPSFSYPTQGTNQVTNTTSAGANAGFGQITQGPHAGNFLFNLLGLNLNGQHQSNEAFTLVPVNDPRKLELMRCAYQKSIAATVGSNGVAMSCPDCEARFATFYTGDPHGDIRQRANGIVTSECIGESCWFHTGCKKCLPKNCECMYVGEYCGIYVWVTAEGRDELTKLTLAILDYAMHDPPVRVTKEVVYYIDEHGLPTTAAASVGKVTANIAINERQESLLTLSSKEESALEQQLRAELDDLDNKLNSPDVIDNPTKAQPIIAERKLLAAKLEYLKTRANLAELNEFVPRDQTTLGPSTPGAVSPNLLQFNQLLNQVK